MPLLLLGPIGAPELLIILMLGLLMFGGRLPDVARSIGKSVNQFKKGLKDLDDDADTADRRHSVPTPVAPRTTLAPPALHAPLIDRSEPTGTAATSEAAASEAANTTTTATTTASGTAGGAAASAATVRSADASSHPPASEPPRA